MKTQAGNLLKHLGFSFDTIMHPELQKLVLYRHSWDQAEQSDVFTDTAAMMVIVLPSQFKVSVGSLVLMMHDLSWLSSLSREAQCSM